MDNENKNLLVNSFEESLLTDFTDISVDFSEELIDDVITDSLIKKIPFVKTVNAIIGTCIAWREKCLIRKTERFLQCFCDKTITKEQLSIYSKKIFKSDKAFKKELERVLFIIDKQSNMVKIEMLANFF